MRVRICSTALFILLIPAIYAPGSVSQWETETISSKPGSVQAQLALDSADNPHVSYRLYYVVSGQTIYDKVLYGRREQTGWNNSVIDLNGGAYTSIATDISGKAHISYFDTPEKNLVHIVSDGSSWDRITVDNSDYVGGFTSIATDGNGNPHISYIDWSNYDYMIKYAYSNGIDWTIEPFPGWSGRTSLALDKYDYPHIAAGSRYGYWNGSSWNIQSFDSGVNAEVSLSLDSSGYPHIAYYHDSSEKVKYAYWDGSGWQRQDIADMTRSYEVVLNLDKNDSPHIMYGFCYYARWNGASWDVEKIADGTLCDFKLDSSDLAHIIYRPNNGLRYMFEVPPPVISVNIDIKPGSCPNPLNVKSKGVLPAAILGTEDFNAAEIDVASILLEGVSPIRSNIEDVATPVSDSNDCNCIEEGPDGYPDLVLKFKTCEILQAIGDVNDGDVLKLELTGVLYDERQIEGADCVLIRGKHKPFNKADFDKDGVVNTIDFAIFTQQWLQSSIVED